jgi:hypothetical protein
MPRKSAAALSVVQSLPGAKRPEPPEELTEEQAVEWRKVVDRLPADWFPQDSHQLLVAYCRHVSRARVLAEMLDRFERERIGLAAGLREYEKLLGMADREHRAISSLATRMRLTQQSRYRGETAKNRAEKANAPSKQWECVA